MNHFWRYGKFSLVLPLILGAGIITLYIVLNDLQIHEYDVRVFLDKDEYHTGEQVILKSTNRGRREIRFDTYYRIMKKINDTWVDVLVLGPNEAWTAAQLILPSGRSFRQVIDLSSLEAGDYMLLKKIDYYDSGEEKTFAVRFGIIE